MGGLSLSIGTQIAIKTNNKKTFSIIFSDVNTQYECETQKLRDFMGDKLIKSMFRSCAMMRGDINGADILIEYNIDDKRFKRPMVSLISALGILNNGKIADIETIRSLIDTEEEVYSFLPAALYGRKNTVVHKDKKSEYLPLNLNGYKIVLSLIDDKGFNIKNILSNADDVRERYIQNECERADRIKNELKNSGTITPEMSAQLKTSAHELFSVIGKRADRLFKMYQISDDTGLASALVPMYSHFGICAFVEDKDVDKYIEVISKECQKKVGTIPTLCICESDDSSIEIRH